MFRLNNIKQNVLILSCATLLAGCGGGGTTTTDSTSLSTTSTNKVVQINISAMTTDDSATIKWTPYGYTAKFVEYGTSNKYGSEVLVQEEGTVTLSNLQAETEYHYRIVSEDDRGRPVVSKDNTFTTLAASTQPIVSDPIVTDPIVTDPIVTDPIVTDPIVTDPIVTDPIVTDPIVTDPIVTDPAPICQSGLAMQQGQVKDSISGIGIADVSVTINGCITQTDANGYYTLNNIVESDYAVVNFEKEGYLLGSTKIQIKELSGDNTTSSNYLEYAIDTYNWVGSYDSQENRTGAHIDIPASVYTDTKGNLYTGTVTASLAFIDVTTDEGKALFTGSFEGMNTNGEIVPFVSYGFISLTFKDSNNNVLNIINDSGATLTFDAVPSLEQQNIIPLWYYDEIQGVWIEEGYAELQANGTYKGNISHSGIWSLNKPIETDLGIYRGSIVDVDGLPLSNVRLYAIGDNWIRSDLSTDADGLFEIKVIPDSSFKLVAYDYKNNFAADYDGIISPIASGSVVDE